MTRRRPTVRNTHLRYVRALERSGDLWAQESDVIIREHSGRVPPFWPWGYFFGPADYDDLEEIDFLP